MHSRTRIILLALQTPGHGAAWCIGMPELCPSPTCAQPLDVSKAATFTTIAAVLKDLVSVLTDAYVHLGGDEANTACWSQSPRIRSDGTILHNSTIPFCD